MTRINCIPVEELHGKHLVAEYRELPRVFKLAEAAFQRGGFQPLETYRLGAGHVKFFYNRLGYCTTRFFELVAEMKRRGYSPQHEQPPIVNVPTDWQQSWSPDDSALQANRQRIAERLADMKA